MEIKQYENRATLKGDKVTLSLIKEDELTFEEAFNVWKKVEQTVGNLIKEKENTLKQIEDKVLDKKIETLDQEMEVIMKLKEDLDKIVAPKVEDVKEKVSKFIKAEKAKRGYHRVGDAEEKQRMKAAIMSEAITGQIIDDVGHPVFSQIWQKFDSI